MKNSIITACLSVAKKHNTPELHPQWNNYSHFSFFVQDSKILAWGTNKIGPPLVLLGYKSTSKIHSEIMAFRKAKSKLEYKKSFEIVNIRLNRNNELRMSKPCPCCMRFLKELGCSSVTFSTDEGFNVFKKE